MNRIQPESRGYHAPSENEMEIVHIYVYEEQSKQISRGMMDRFMAQAVRLLAIGMLSIFCVAPYTPIYATKVISVPAHFLPRQIFSAYSSIVPTGKIEHPATQAHGTLTIYNGSIFSQVLPQGFILMSKDGQEITTDTLVQIPPGNPPTYGIETVSAQAVTVGLQGNISANSIQAVYGSSIIIRNLSPFRGGQDEYNEQVTTPEDTTKALKSAREQVAMKIPIGLLASPCAEEISRKGYLLAVSWSCQYVTYTVPDRVKVLSARVQGKSVILQISIIVQPA